MYMYSPNSRWLCMHTEIWLHCCVLFLDMLILRELILVPLQLF